MYWCPQCTVSKWPNEMPWMLLWKGETCPVSQKTQQCQSTYCCLSLCCCLASEKTEINNSRSSQSHQVTRSFPCSAGGGLMRVCVCEMRLQFGVKEERKLKQRETSAVPLHLMAVLGVKSVCLADWMWGCLHNKGISFSQRWPSTCLLNEFDIAMDTLAGGRLRGNTHAGAFKDDMHIHAVNQTIIVMYCISTYCNLCVPNAQMLLYISALEYSFFC